MAPCQYLEEKKLELRNKIIFLTPEVRIKTITIIPSPYDPLSNTVTKLTNVPTIVETRAHS